MYKSSIDFWSEIEKQSPEIYSEMQKKNLIPEGRIWIRKNNLSLIWQFFAIKGIKMERYVPCYPMAEFDGNYNNYLCRIVTNEGIGPAKWITGNMASWKFLIKQSINALSK